MKASNLRSIVLDYIGVGSIFSDPVDPEIVP